jgi:hypothetical protein
MPSGLHAEAIKLGSVATRELQLRGFDVRSVPFGAHETAEAICAPVVLPGGLVKLDSDPLARLRVDMWLSGRDNDGLVRSAVVVSRVGAKRVEMLRVTVREALGLSVCG